MSLTAEDLQAIKAIIKEETDPINKRLDNIEADIVSMKEDIEVIKEDIEIIKGVNEEVLEWFDTYQRTDIDKPFPAPVKEIV